MTNKLTNQIVDQRLVESNRSLQRYGDVVNSSTKTKWNCLYCNNIWEATPNSVLRGSGCPNCNGKQMLSNNDVDAELKTRPIKRIDNYCGFDRKINWRCENCSYVWKATPNNIITKGSECPECSKYTHGESKRLKYKQDVENMLEEKSIQMVDTYYGVNYNYTFRCLMCGTEWNTNLNTIKNNDSNCPKCSKNLPITNEQVDNALAQQQRNIYRIQNIENANTKIKWCCRVCETGWKATPDSVLNLGSGCPNCSHRGLYNEQYLIKNPELKDQTSRLYLVKFTNYKNNITFLKVGITKKTVKQRFSNYMHEYDIEPLFELKTNLQKCIDTENQVLQMFSEYRQSPGKFSGHTECFCYTDYIQNQLLNYLKTFDI